MEYHQANICITGVTEGKERVKRVERLFEERISKKPPNLGKTLIYVFKKFDKLQIQLT